MSGACGSQDAENAGRTPQADEYVARLIQVKAHQLVHKAGFTESDREDIEQELTLHVLEHLHDYDPSRSSRHTFIARVVEHKAADLIDYRTAKMRTPRRVEQSLDETLVDAEGALTDRASMMAGNESTPGALRDAAIDLAEVLQQLPPRLRALCKRLPDATMQEIADEFGVARRTVYRWIDQIRDRLQKAGLDDYI